MSDINRLRSVLVSSGLQSKDNALYQVINELIAMVGNISGGGSGGGNGGEVSGSNIAYKDEPNIFTENQLIRKALPNWIAESIGATSKARVGNPTVLSSYYSYNLYYDGTAWRLDDSTKDGYMVYFSINGIYFYRGLAGTNPATLVVLVVMENVGVLNLVNSGRISFPPVQIASTDPNTLDDYEEGSWAPVVFSDGGGNATLSTAAGLYVKIGKKVFISCRVTLTSKAGMNPGFVYINGLPFTTAPQFFTAFSSYWTGAAANNAWWGAAIYPSNTIMYLSLVIAPATTIALCHTTNIGSTQDIILSGSYISVN